MTDNKKGLNQTRSIFFTKRTLKELEVLQDEYGENRSRVIGHLITEAYFNLKKERSSKT